MLLLYHSSIFGCKHPERRDVPVYFVMLSASEASRSDDTTRFFVSLRMTGRRYLVMSTFKPFKADVACPEVLLIPDRTEVAYQHTKIEQRHLLIPV